MSDPNMTHTFGMYFKSFFSVPCSRRDWLWRYLSNVEEREEESLVESVDVQRERV